MHHVPCYNERHIKMIKTFKCKETEKVWFGDSSRKFPRNIQDRAFRKLRQLNAAVTVEDLRNPPGNNLENLHGDRKGHMSIRVNNQWRLCFRFENGEAFDVQIIDYH